MHKRFRSVLLSMYNVMVGRINGMLCRINELARESQITEWAMLLPFNQDINQYQTFISIDDLLSLFEIFIKLCALERSFGLNCHLKLLLCECSRIISSII